jgi:ubiquinone/menaquinone biosynthesis C-methylase UbiE
VRGCEQIPWVYDAGMALLERTGLGRWRAWLARGGRGRVLDLGCGTGRTLPLFEPSARVVALDPCRDVLRRAGRRAPRALLVQAQAEALPFRDGVFDVVTGGLVFCSVGDPPAGLREARRVLAPGGALRLLEHVRSHHAWQAWLQDRLQPAWTRFTGGCHPNRETERAVTEAGFEIDPASRRARGTLRRFVARPRAEGA